MQANQNLPIPAPFKAGKGVQPVFGPGGISSSISARIDKILTPAGADFVHRSCHPNDDARAGGVFIPDDTTADRAILETRPFAVINAPSELPEGSNWDCELAVLSTPDIPFVYRTRPTSRSSSIGSGWGKWLVGASDSYVSYGQVRCAKAVNSGPIALTEQATVRKTPSLLNDSTQFRQAFKGITVLMNAATMYDQGFVTAGQWGNKGKLVQVTPNSGDFSSDDRPSGFDGNDYEKVDSLLYEGVPTEMAGIISVCPEYGQWEAKRGIYMPMRYDDPVHTFNGGAESVLRPWDGSSGVPTGEVKSGHAILLQDDTSQKINFAASGVFSTYEGVTPGAINYAATSAGDVNQTFGIALFSGIDPKSQLIIKCRTGLDLVPAPRSPFAAMAKKGPIKDQLALDLATSIQAKLPVVYEHKYNSLSLILPWIANAAMDVLPVVAPWIGKKVAEGIDWLGKKVFRTGMPNA